MNEVLGAAVAFLCAVVLAVLAMVKMPPVETVYCPPPCHTATTLP